jgi:tetratricopeptide (TPR) repeat protein
LEAIPHAEKAIQLSPKSADAHELLGRLLAKTNQHEKAIVNLKCAVKIEETARRYELLAGSLADLERWPEAEAAFRRGAELEPNNSDTLANLGATLVNQNKLAEALQFFERAASANPGNIDAQMARA